MVRNVIGGALGALAGLISIAAGVYLLVERSDAATNAGVYDAAMTDVIAHGMGVYFIGKGLAIWSLAALGLRGPFHN